jgi:hypothetical protein
MKKKLLESILSNTKSGYLKWNIRKTIFDSETNRNYECLINDGSVVKLEIVLDENLSYKNCAIIQIENKNLVNGGLMIHKYELPEVEEIGKEVYNMYISPNIQVRPKTNDDVLGEIINAIPSIEEKRDQKISDILYGTEKDDNIFSRLFRKK